MLSKLYYKLGEMSDNLSFYTLLFITYIQKIVQIYFVRLFRITREYMFILTEFN